MREQVNETVVCLCCGARAADVPPAPRAAPVTRQQGQRRVESFAREARAVTKRRSGLAYAAGYAGLAYLFGYGFAPATHAAGGSRLVALIGAYGEPASLPFWNLWAPAAIVLAFAAASSIDHARDRAGALPAVLGLVVGLWGTLVWLFDLLAPGSNLSVGM